MGNFSPKMVSVREREEFSVIDAICRISKVNKECLEENVPEYVLNSVEQESELIAYVAKDIFELEKLRHPFVPPQYIYPDEKSDNLLLTKTLFNTLYLALQLESFKNGCLDYNERVSTHQGELNFELMELFKFESCAENFLRRVTGDELDGVKGVEGESKQAIFSLGILELYEIVFSLERTHDWIRFNESQDWENTPITFNEEEYARYVKQIYEKDFELSIWDRGSINYQEESSLNGFPLNLNLVDIHFYATNILEKKGKRSGGTPYVFSAFITEVLNEYGFDRLYRFYKGLNRVPTIRDEETRKTNRINFNNHKLIYTGSQMLQSLSLNSRKKRLSR